MFEDSGEDRAIRFMRSGEIADAHEKLVDDLPSGEAKGLPKQPGPVLRRARVVSIEPAGKRPVRISQRLDPPRILGRRLDFEAVTYDSRIGEQAVDIRWSKVGDAVDVEIGEGGAKCRSFFEDCQPRQPRLVDFKDESLEKHAFLGCWKTIFAVVVETVHRVPGRNSAIRRAQLTARGN